MSTADEDRRLTRRTFLRRSTIFTAAAVTGIAAPFARGAPRFSARQEETYIDFQVHLGQKWADRPAMTPDHLLRWMDEHGISHAVVHPLVNPEARVVPLTTGWVLEQIRPHGDRLIPFCVIDPRHPSLDGVRPKVDLIERYVEAGARGFGEHKIGLPVDDPRNLELYQACAELELPILIHMDGYRNTDRPGLPGLENALQQVPDATFVGHAQGWWASISGDVTEEDMYGYPDGPVAPGGALDRLFDAYPNLYGDLSAGSGANAIERDREFGREFVIRWADRLLFATDYLAPEQEVPQFELYRSLDLPKRVEAKVYRENARKLLGLD
jgi:predicted TIM-barrel fold metal-dependent hydrolase